MIIQSFNYKKGRNGNPWVQLIEGALKQLTLSVIIQNKKAGDNLGILST